MLETARVLISDVISWTVAHGRITVGRLAWIYIHQPCTDIVSSLEDLPGEKNDRGGWREKELGNSVQGQLDDDDDRNRERIRFCRQQREIE